MFSDPANALNQLFVTPGLGLELTAASFLALGIACYLARVAWIALSESRRIEAGTPQQAVRNSEEFSIDRPYCAG
jgi:hypothetical protein